MSVATGRGATRIRRIDAAAFAAVPLMALLLVASGCSTTSAPGAGGTPASAQVASDGSSPLATASPGTRPPTTVARRERVDQGRSPASGTIGKDSSFPELGDPTYDVSHYDLSLVFDPRTGHLVGRERIEAMANVDADEFRLDLRGLEVDEVLVDDRPAASEVTPTKLVVRDVSLRRDQPFSVTVAYAGSPTPVATRALGGAEVGWHSQDGGSFVLSEPEGSSTWFALNNSVLDKATYSFRITVPAPYTAIANGRLDRVEDLAPGAAALPDERDVPRDVTRRTFSWVMDRPMASYLPSVVTGVYTPSGATTVDGVEYENWLPDELVADPGALDSQADDVAMLAARLGPFPFSTYGGVVYPRSFTPGTDWTDKFLGSVALETQGRSTFSERSLNRATVIHEAAHQWMGDAVTLSDWGRDLWWVEGFARFTEDLPRLARDAASFDRAWQARYAKTARSWRPVGSIATADLFEWSYEGGATVFWALWRTVGDETFWKIVRTFQDRHRYGNATTDDLVRVASEVTGQDMKPFFDTWLFSTTAPPAPPPPGN